MWRKQIVLSVAILGLVSANAHGGSRWNELLLHPGSESFAMLAADVVSSPGRRSEDVTPTQRQRNRLFRLIESGDQWAFRAALLVSRCWDGGEAEDFDRSAGAFFEHRPHTFLHIAQENATSNRELDRMLTMLSLDTVDDVDAQLSVVEKRISILKAVQDPSLSDIKERAISFLEKDKIELSEVQSEMKEYLERPKPPSSNH
jgi:hypothetical protein